MNLADIQEEWDCFCSQWLRSRWFTVFLENSPLLTGWFLISCNKLFLTSFLLQPWLFQQILAWLEKPAKQQCHRLRNDWYLIKWLHHHKYTFAVDFWLHGAASGWKTSLSFRETILDSLFSWNMMKSSRISTNFTYGDSKREEKSDFSSPSVLCSCLDMRSSVASFLMSCLLSEGNICQINPINSYRSVCVLNENEEIFNFAQEVTEKNTFLNLNFCLLFWLYNSEFWVCKNYYKSLRHF